MQNNPIMPFLERVTLAEAILIVGAIVALIITAGTGIVKFYKLAVEIHKKLENVGNLIETVNETKDKVDTLERKFDVEMASSKDYRLRSLGDKLFICYNTAIRQGYITRRQLENFTENLNMYYELGGNGIVKKKYEPEVLAMLVKEE